MFLKDLDLEELCLVLVQSKKQSCLIYFYNFQLPFFHFFAKD